MASNLRHSVNFENMLSKLTR